MNCEKCPQYNKICYGVISDKKYCFYFHGHRERQTIQFDDLIEFVKQIINEMNKDVLWLDDGFEFKKYGYNGFYILILHPLDLREGKKFPIGYIWTK